MSKLYLGHHVTRVVVVVRGNGSAYILDPARHVRDHSPTGYAWGYCGSGPAQLALALCMDVLEGDSEIALEVYHHVAHHLVACFPAHGGFEVGEDAVNEAIMDALDDLGRWIPTPEAVACQSSRLAVGHPFLDDDEAE